jgi:hypothetical protein
MEKGILTSLKSKQTGEVFIRGVDVASCPALQLIYRGDETVSVDESKFGTIETHALSDHRAEAVGFAQLMEAARGRRSRCWSIRFSIGILRHEEKNTERTIEVCLRAIGISGSLWHVRTPG